MEYIDILKETFIQTIDDLYTLIKDKQYSNIEWSIGVLLENGNQWFFRLECNEYIFEKCASIENDIHEYLSFKDQVASHIEYSTSETNKIIKVYFRAKIWGFNNLDVFNAMTIRGYDILMKLQEQYHFELDYKKKMK